MTTRLTTTALILLPTAHLRACSRRFIFSRRSYALRSPLSFTLSFCYSPPFAATIHVTESTCIV